MQLVANQQLVKNRARLGTAFHLGALGVFAVGLVLSLRLEQTAQLPLAAWAAIAVGMVLYSLGQTQLRRWGPRHRQDEQLGAAIRGLDDRYRLYAFLATSLPDYILVSPAGIHVIVARGEAGQVTCQRDRWKRSGGTRLFQLLEPGLGNPTADAQKQVAKIRPLLAAAGLADVPLSGLIVFTNPKVQLRVEGCSATLTRLKELKDVLRRLAGKGPTVALSSARVREVQAFFDRRMQAAHPWR